MDRVPLRFPEVRRGPLVAWQKMLLMVTKCARHERVTGKPVTILIHPETIAMPGDDHDGAMTSEMLADLVARTTRVEAMLGSERKEPVDAERRARNALRVRMHEVEYH